MIRRLAPLAAAASLATAGAVVVPAQATSVAHVRVTNNAFTPKTLKVKKGTKIVWTWTQGGVPHNVTPDNGKPGSATSARKGFTFTKVMSRRGTFRYHCSIHPGMKLAIKVR